MIYEIKYTPEADKDIEQLIKSGDKAAINKLFKLIMELMEHPYMGTGKPEPMKYGHSGLWSRRINKKHRLIYSVDDEKIIVLVLSATGHYDDK